MKILMTNCIKELCFMTYLNTSIFFVIRAILLAIFLFTFGCDDFVDIEPPTNEVVDENVFTTDETARAAMNGVYIIMNGTGIFSTDLEVFTGIFSDELSSFDDQQDFQEFATNEIFPENNILLSRFWIVSYQAIDNANGVIEGLENNDEVTRELRDQLLAEALFIRAYVHFYLTNLFGPIPYSNTTNIEINNTAPRQPQNDVYQNIINDLTRAQRLFEENLEVVEESSSVRPNYWASTAMLARVFLYSEEWGLAEIEASDVIDNGFFLIEDDLNSVFRATSREAIWQLVPRDGFQTPFSVLFPITLFGPGGFGEFGRTGLREEQLGLFDTDDRRLNDWIESNGSVSYPFKYKNGLEEPFGPGLTDFPEYQVMLRLAELYLIRAESRIRQGDVTGAQEDINIVRLRAGLVSTTEPDSNNLLREIMEERQRELFTEGGHRWFDLKRTNSADEVLTILKPLWDNTDVLWPIPENEIFNNSNLLPQNEGY